MPRNDGNKTKNEELEKMELTLKNIKKNEDLLAESADELTPHQLKDIRAHLVSKKKFLKEMDGTIK
jgi:hypothetical protein